MPRKNSRFLFGMTAGLLVTAVAAWGLATRLEAGSRGPTGHRSIGALTFSPYGDLFFADPQGAAVYMIDLEDAKGAKAASMPKLADLGATLAARMGTTAGGVAVQDMAVSPVSGTVYVSVVKRDGGNRAPADPGSYALFAIDAKGAVKPVDLSDVQHAKVTLGTAGDAELQRITDIALGGGRLLVAAQSNEEFASKLYSVPVPFTAPTVQPASTSIYHTSHKKWETKSPIQTLTSYSKDGRDYVIGAYVCTPIVRFSLDSLQPGGVAKGVTVAELGAGNRPLEMVAYGKQGQESLLVSNNNHGVLKVEPRILTETSAVDEKTTADRARGNREVPGIERVPSLEGVTEMGMLSDSRLVVLRSGENGAVSLETAPLP